MAKRSRYRKHAFIPDTQVAPGVKTDHLEAAGRYLLEKRPDVIVHAGDHWDMSSLSMYDKPAAKGFNHEDTAEDFESGNEALERLDAPITAWNRAHRGAKQYHPRKILLRGNHENRVVRATINEPWMRNVLLGQFNNRDWEVIPFLKPIRVDGISYCHFFPRSASGRVMNNRRGQANARLQVMREGMSCTAGHLQGLDSHIQMVGARTRRRGIIAGSFYQHEPDYLSPQGQHHWRGILLKHEVRAGDFDLLEVSMAYLLRAYT